MGEDSSATLIIDDDCSMVSVPKSIKCTIGTHKEQKLPDPFPLPQNYRYDVEIALKSGEMTRETTSAFLSAVANAMLAYKKRPTAEEYVRISMDIIRKYPFLKDKNSDSPIVSAFFKRQLWAREGVGEYGLTATGGGGGGQGGSDMITCRSFLLSQQLFSP